MGILIGAFILIVFMLVMGYALQKDLKDIEKTDPRFRKHLKDRYGL